jgi:hypothetical protein
MIMTELKITQMVLREVLGPTKNEFVFGIMGRGGYLRDQLPIATFLVQVWQQWFHRSCSTNHLYTRQQNQHLPSGGNAYVHSWIAHNISTDA